MEASMSVTEDRKSEIAEEMEADIEYREDSYLDNERARREDLNQGMNTGTHDFTHRGVNWPPSYRIRGNSHAKSKI
jgi:phage host-nuclease inhibitor protein Gam